MGISKKSMLNDYYFDEFFAVLDEYNDMHNMESKEELKEVGTADW